MSSPRITQRLMTQHSLGSMQTALGRLAKTQEQMTTGRIINRPSDDPTGTNTAMRLRAQLASQTQYGRNAQDGSDLLKQTESSITAMSTALRRGRELVLQGSSTGSSSEASRTALAQELTQIRNELLAQANTQYLGRPIFAGTADVSGAAEPGVAFAADGTFQGNNEPITRTVGDGVDVTVNTSADSVFGPNGANVFNALNKAITDLTDNPAGLGDDLDALDAAMNTMTTSLSDIGARSGRIDAAVTKVADVTLDLKSSLAGVENVDIAQGAMDLQMQEVAYQAALGATSRVIQQSLLDFLR